MRKGRGDCFFAFAVGLSARCRGGIPDIFIPRVRGVWMFRFRGARDENSGMTMVMTRLGEGGCLPALAGGGSFRSGMQSPTGAEFASGAWRDAFPSGAWGTTGRGALGNDRVGAL